MEGSHEKKRARVDSDESTEFDSPEVKRLREDLLSCIDESDPGIADPTLDSFMRSFEEEISASPLPERARVDSGESPELGYLLEASDDELGLPPSASNDDVVELVRVSSDSSVELSELWRFDDDQVPSYDSFELGLGYDVSGHDVYDPADVLFDSYDDTVSLWRSDPAPFPAV